MAPLITLIVVTLLARITGALNLGRGYFATFPSALCVGVSAMFLLTGGAHFIWLRDDLIRMVPPALGNPDFWVTFTGVAEIAGAIGILIPATRRLAAVGLKLLLLALFPANVYAATHKITFDNEAPTPLIQRSLEQIIYFAAVAWAGFSRKKVVSKEAHDPYVA